MVHSNLINGLAPEVEVADFTPWWKPAMICADAAIAVLYVGATVVYLIAAYAKKKEGK